VAGRASVRSSMSLGERSSENGDREVKHEVEKL
jgi:hypothetical protein